MKTRLFILGIFLFGCQRIDHKGGLKDYDILIIDSCEYIVIENSLSGANNYSISVTHKGNCKNHEH